MKQLSKFASEKAFMIPVFHIINRSPRTYDLGEYENWWRHFFTVHLARTQFDFD